MRFNGPARRELHRWTANVRSKSSRRRTCVTLTSRNQASVVHVVFRYPYIPHLVRRQNVDLDVDYATTLVAALLLGIGFVLQQYAARQEPESRFLSPRILTDLLRKPRWLAGIACMVAGQLLAAWSIGHAALTLVEPLLTTYLLFALLLAIPMSKQAMHWTEVAGARHLDRPGGGPGLRYSGRADQADAGDPAGASDHRPAHQLGAVLPARRRDRGPVADAERVQRGSAARLAAHNRGRRAGGRHRAGHRGVRRPD